MTYDELRLLEFVIITQITKPTEASESAKRIVQREIKMKLLDPRFAEGDNGGTKTNVVRKSD